MSKTQLHHIPKISPLKFAVVAAMSQTASVQFGYCGGFVSGYGGGVSVAVGRGFGSTDILRSDPFTQDRGVMTCPICIIFPVDMCRTAAMSTKSRDKIDFTEPPDGITDRRS